MDTDSRHQKHVSITAPTARKTVEGFRTPDRSPPSANELGWIECLRTIVGDRDPPPTLRAVVALRQALLGE